MIVCKDFPNKEFATHEDLFKELRANKTLLINLKKKAYKICDAINLKRVDLNAAPSLTTDAGTISVKTVMNTTNIFDSHNDVHLDGIWNKSLADNKTFLHLQEHEMKFENVIDDKATAQAETVRWRDLGLNINGKTQALIFTSEIDKNRNEEMFKQYSNGWVNSHSVGMQYVKLELAINSMSEFDAEEKAVWDKYYDSIANKDEVDAYGYFWAIQEAKLIEGSSVVMGSNAATPTIEITEAKEQSNKNIIPIEPSKNTQKTIRRMI